jgi:hypothetical protein
LRGNAENPKLDEQAFGRMKKEAAVIITLELPPEIEAKLHEGAAKNEP